MFKMVMVFLMFVLYSRKRNSEQLAFLMGSTALAVTCRRLDVVVSLVLTSVLEMLGENRIRT